MQLENLNFIADTWLIVHSFICKPDILNEISDAETALAKEVKGNVNCTNEFDGKLFLFWKVILYVELAATVKDDDSTFAEYNLAGVEVNLTEDVSISVGVEVL